MDIFISGASTGIIQTVIGHPLDTLKTRIQCGQAVSCTRLYHGSLPSFLVNILQNSFLFSTHDWVYRSHENHFVAGTLSGTMCSFFVSPLELWKVRRQNANQSFYKPTDIYKGLQMTLLRDSFGVGIYFSTYHHLMNRYPEECFMNGGIAGIMSWVYSYPFDVIKSRIQNNQPLHYYGLYKGFSFVALRAFLVNSLVFSCFEFVKDGIA